MATINLAWVPGGGAATAQRIKRIAKANGSTPTLTVVFSPTNDLSSSQAVATAQSLNTNTIYRFIVQSICPEGDPVSNSNGVVEGIVFECLEDADVTVTYATSGLTKSATVSIALPNATPVDGGSTISNYTDISKVEMAVYNAANSTQVKSAVTVSQTSGVASHQFTGLAASTTYTLRYVLIANINGGDVRSDDEDRLNATCSVQFTTSAL